MRDREIMQQALEEQPNCKDGSCDCCWTDNTAQPDPEPVAAAQALRHAAQVVQLYDDACLNADYIIDSNDCEKILIALAEYYEAGHTAPPQREWQPKGKLWLWKNFVEGRPEYWAFDNPYPTNLDDGDPQTLGQPCGYAIFKPSRDGSDGRTEEQVLREMKSVTKQREWQGLTDEEVNVEAVKEENPYEFIQGALWAEAKLKEKNGY